MYNARHQELKDKIHIKLIVFGTPSSRARTRTRRVRGVSRVKGGGLRKPAELHFMAKVATAMALPLEPATPSGGRPKGIGIPVAPPPEADGGAATLPWGRRPPPPRAPSSPP